MGDRDRDRDREREREREQSAALTKSFLRDKESSSKGPTATQALSVAVLLPVGGGLLALSAVTLAATVVGLALATPLFLLFSPVLVPAAIAVGLAVAGFLASGAFGASGMASLSWVANKVRRALMGGDGEKGGLQEQMEAVKRRMAETAGQAGQAVGQRTKEVGQGIQSRGQEAQQHART